jgi:uncharacterized protein (TIGR02301 family)
MRHGSIMLAASVALCLGTAPARAVDAPYDAGLYRIAEILGSLHFLRNLCGEKGDAWREQMEKLISTESPDAERRARFVANFNRGYRAFANTYTTCTSSAIEAINLYTTEGEQLSDEIASRYGN